MAVRVPLSMSARRGALVNTRGEAVPQSGQYAGWLRSLKLR
jgi:hypothetical protein